MFVFHSTTEENSFSSPSSATASVINMTAARNDTFAEYMRGGVIMSMGTVTGDTQDLDFTDVEFLTRNVND